MSGIMLALDAWRPFQVVVAIFDQRKHTWFALAAAIVSRKSKIFRLRNGLFEEYLSSELY